MKITISKSQWEEMGKKAGWTKIADIQPNYENQLLPFINTVKYGLPEEKHQEFLMKIKELMDWVRGNWGKR